MSQNNYSDRPPPKLLDQLRAKCRLCTTAFARKRHTWVGVRSSFFFTINGIRTRWACRRSSGFSCYRLRNERWRRARRIRRYRRSFVSLGRLCKPNCRRLMRCAPSGHGRSSVGFCLVHPYEFAKSISLRLIVVSRLLHTVTDVLKSAPK